MMPNVEKIISQFGYPESRQEYYDTMMDHIATARLTRSEILNIDKGVLWCYQKGWINNINDLYENFTQVCMLDSIRPLEYWTYLFHLPMKYENVVKE